MSAAGEYRRSYDMTISREEFMRLLPGAVGGAAYREEAAAFVRSDAVSGWRLELESLPDLRHGSLMLPRHRVELRLIGYGQEEASLFLSRFEARFLRGGG